MIDDVDRESKTGWRYMGYCALYEPFIVALRISQRSGCWSAAKSPVIFDSRKGGGVGRQPLIPTLRCDRSSFSAVRPNGRYRQPVPACHVRRRSGHL